MPIAILPGNTLGLPRFSMPPMEAAVPADTVTLNLDDVKTLAKAALMNVGCDASIGVNSVSTPFTCEYVPVRIEARDGAHSELVANRLSNRTPHAANSSMRGVSFTTDP